jgi:hypothetical protein
MPGGIENKSHLVTISTGDTHMIRSNTSGGIELFLLYRSVRCFSSMYEFSVADDQFLLLPASNLYGPSIRAAFSTLIMQVMLTKGDCERSEMVASSR